MQDSSSKSSPGVNLKVLLSQVISDFDMTLTRFAHNGRRVPTTHSKDSRHPISSLFNTDLLNTYYPVEIDASRSTEEKLPHMVDWWTKVHELLIQQKIRKDLLAQAVKESTVMLRDGYKEFFDHLAEQQVPLLIFSAGVGDILEEVIQQNRVFHPNTHVISNYMDFDHVEQRKESYVNSFDIVLVKDETMDVPNAVLRHIISGRDRK
uniref:5'-nucleotidase, cytosolic IIIB n=1 Tax=Salarias fasciatus TaxID=181472 RepID=A0A672FII0_SALFA